MRPAGTGTDSTATRGEAGAARRVLHGALGRAVRIGARGAGAVRRRAG
jgi:hypothetical protein